MQGNLRLNDGWKYLVIAASEWEYDVVHTHEEIAEIMGIPYEDGSYTYAISKARKELLTGHQRYLDNKPGKGYRIIRPEEHVPKSSTVIHHGLSKVAKGVAIAYHAPSHLLSDRDNRVLTDYLTRSSRLLESTTRDVAKLHYLASQKEIPKPKLEE